MTSMRPTVADLFAEKGSRQRTDVYVDSLAEAVAASDAGIDIITVQDSLMSDDYRLAAPSAFMVAGLEYGVHVTTDDYLRAGFSMMELGADAVWSAASLETISRMRAEGIPVVGHVGLIPARRTWTGGFRAVGQDSGECNVGLRTDEGTRRSRRIRRRDRSGPGRRGDSDLGAHGAVHDLDGIGWRL